MTDMPIYVSKCDKCGKTREEFRPVSKYKIQPVCCSALMRPVVTSPYIVPDIQPYKAIAADKETGKAPTIMGRKQHRDFLRRNGYEELGNDPVKPTQHDDRAIDRTADSIAREIRQRWLG